MGSGLLIKEQVIDKYSYTNGMLDLTVLKALRIYLPAGITISLSLIKYSQLTVSTLLLTRGVLSLIFSLTKQILSCIRIVLYLCLRWQQTILHLQSYRPKMNNQSFVLRGKWQCF